MGIPLIVTGGLAGGVWRLAAGGWRLAVGVKAVPQTPAPNPQPHYTGSQ